MITSQLPILQVVLPLVCAPACLVAGRGRYAWLIAVVGSWAALIISILLLNTVMQNGVQSYALGGWAAPWGIEYRIDSVNALVLLIVASISAVVLPFAYTSVVNEISEEHQGLFYTAYMLCLTGLLGIAITGDAFNLFVFLEISSLSSYVLVALGRDRRALTASYQYLIMGTIGATFILIGIGLLYMLTGTLNMVDLASRMSALTETRTLRAAFAFLIVGIGLKAAMFPLHLWLPNAYAYAPSVVTAFLAATATKVAIYMLARFTYSIFGVDFSYKSMPLTEIFAVLAIIAVLTASMVAIFQENVKRMLAYSSLAQIGYMLIGLSLASETGLIAALLHLFNHAMMKGALFLALGCIAYRLGTSELKGLSGIGYTMPWTTAAFVFGGLSLIGVPLTVGFISKWYLVLAALERGWWLMVVVVLIGSLLSVVYVWRVVETAYFGSNKEGSSDVTEAPLSLLIPTWLLVIANLYFGIDTSLTTSVTQNAATTLLNGMQP